LEGTRQQTQIDHAQLHLLGDNGHDIASRGGVAQGRHSMVHSFQFAGSSSGPLLLVASKSFVAYQPEISDSWPVVQEGRSVKQDQTRSRGGVKWNELLKLGRYSMKRRERWPAPKEDGDSYSS
jgi:hypothetical protein